MAIFIRRHSIVEKLFLKPVQPNFSKVYLDFISCNIYFFETGELNDVRGVLLTCCTNGEIDLTEVGFIAFFDLDPQGTS